MKNEDTPKINVMDEVFRSIHENEHIGSEEFNQEILTTNPAEVDDQYGGQVFTVVHGDKNDINLSLIHSQTFVNFQRSQGIRDLMAKAGFLYDYYDDGRLKDVKFPDPKRLAKACELNGIEIQFLDQASGIGSIPETEYGKTVSDGKHPVGVSSLKYYEHDIKVDHLPAVIVLKDKLPEIFNPNNKIITNENESIAQIYDIFTNSVCEAIFLLLENRFNNLFDFYIKESTNKILGLGSDANRREEFSSNLKATIFHNLDSLQIKYPK
jgi:hypothetical protein